MIFSETKYDSCILLSKFNTNRLILNVICFDTNFTERVDANRKLVGYSIGFFLNVPQFGISNIKTA